MPWDEAHDLVATDNTIAAFGYDDCPGHPVWLDPAEWLGSEQAKVHPLHLLSNQPRSRLHSQLDCGEISRNAKVADREPVWLNPDDAAAQTVLVEVECFNGAAPPITVFEPPRVIPR